MYFNTLDDALQCLSIQPNLKLLLIAHCKGSYESFTQNGRVLYCIGQGRKRTPGHPSGHQNLSNQILLKKSETQRLYPAFRIFPNCVEYMGEYRLVSYRRTMSFEGFLYFEYKLLRDNLYNLIKIPSDHWAFEMPVAVELAPKYFVDVDSVYTKPVPELEVKLAPVVSTGFCWFPTCSSIN